MNMRPMIRLAASVSPLPGGERSDRAQPGPGEGGRAVEILHSKFDQTDDVRQSGEGRGDDWSGALPEALAPPHPARRRSPASPRQGEVKEKPRILSLVAMAFLACAALLAAAPAAAQKISNPIAVFAGLDKITARVTSFEVAIDQTVQFGALKVTPRVCYTRPPTEPPFTSAFVEVDEVLVDKSEKRIFTGWMFADSPGLHAVEHPVFDVWLTDCKMSAPEAPEPRR